MVGVGGRDLFVGFKFLVVSFIFFKRKDRVDFKGIKYFLDVILFFVVR